MTTPEENVRLTRRGRVIVFLVAIALIVAIPSIGGYIYLRSIGVFGSSAPGPPVEVVIDEGTSSREIGKLLEQRGIIASAFGFRIALYIEGGAENIQAGKYELATGLSARDALSALLKGPIIEFVTVTFPEGSWLTDFARTFDRLTHLSAERFLELATSGAVRSRYQPEGIETLEGLLFPSTYQVIEEDTEESVLQRLVNEFDKQATAVELSARAQQLGVTPYEAVIVASMVEAEARAQADRDKIARVIYNRIEQGMKLEIDATVLYALGEHKEELTQSDLAIDSPYNTRLYEGMPPTPIGASGAASLEAAVNPADGEWLFYVLSDCEGHHHFSEDYDDFLAAKARYQELNC